VYDADVRRYARILLQAATALPEAERLAETEQLRRALAEVGEVDLARTTAVADRPGPVATGAWSGTMGGGPTNCPSARLPKREGAPVVLAEGGVRPCGPP
jgi:hypothetical protein